MIILRLIRVDDIKPDMKLAKPIYLKNSILLNKGVGNLSKYKNRLKEFGIYYIYIEDKFSKDIEITDVVKNSTRHNCKKLVKRTFKDISFQKKIPVKEIKQSVTQIVEELLAEELITVNLIDIKSFDSYTFEHSVNVTILSIILGRSLNMHKQNLIKLGIGAILHDIGKILIPQKILNKPSPLNNEEFEIIQKHTTLGFEYIQDYKEISPRSQKVILQHHERIDGSGYPGQLTGSEMSRFAKIVAVTDVFDALTSDRVYRPRWSIKKTIDYLISNADSLFAHEYIRAFIKNIAVYPNGVTVKLSNGKRAIIKQQNINYPTRPIVKIIENENTFKIVDLLERNDLVITDVE